MLVGHLFFELLPAPAKLLSQSHLDSYYCSICSASFPETGIGELYVYDTSFRIGAS